MEALRPHLVWIGNRCYRKNPTKDATDDFRPNPEDEDMDGMDFRQDAAAYCDEVCDASLNILETSKGLRLEVEVPSVYFKYVIGKKGETKRRLETETRTQLIVPKQGDKDEIIVILGRDKKGIVSAKTRLDVLVDSARQHQPFTHFLSVPVNVEEVMTGFDDFKFDVLRECDGDQGVDVSLFQNPRKLHMTIGTLALVNDTEVRKALSVLQACEDELVSPILKGERLDVAVRGLEYMNDDPRAVDVLYAKLSDSPQADRLQILVERIVDRFVSEGLMRQEYDRVKLHVTVMNTLFRKDKEGVTEQTKKAGFGGKDRETFDASRILKNYGDFHFGTLHVPSIHLSQRFSSGEDGYYRCAGQAFLPS